MQFKFGWFKLHWFTVTKFIKHIINCYKVELFIGYKFELDLLLNKSVVQ